MTKTQQKTIESRVDANQAVIEYCLQRGYKLELIRSRRRQKELINMRVNVINYLRGLGFSYPVIGYVINRDHTSVLYLAKPKKREEKKRYHRERYHENKMAFCKQKEA